ncbi:hypothetical protein GE21DRAFT_10412 [Neurospora crassa]|uniref:Secreted protein n=1 Tax=Neurospora crassa (strain ATCC 24698 / 74-OR23-1A / CBS 708.71 / DSM 1257 / FGSC 987) TaxID=367110 RepID=Q7S573_NEUCR|nr:hypothetical protein NCU02297 [Neurospora crassa OR74A]EAA30705.1 hypothetical protein NCU02297 [Neurospora crassa OR74A]KHE84825.1 hypothetical protein GE21DRAFT_10412 [Neurospora crassa]|eukprot:XP_959941.1 hypothetical protein NCU02297 [Neurospora crassa OR74A]
MLLLAALLSFFFPLLFLFVLVVPSNATRTHYQRLGHPKPSKSQRQRQEKPTLLERGGGGVAKNRLHVLVVAADVDDLANGPLLGIVTKSGTRSRACSD